jgi:hypothetical protein
VNDGTPALQFVVSGTMKNIGRAHRNTRCTRFDQRKTGVIINGIIGQKYFLATAPSHIQRGKVVQSTGGRNASE